jgi:hypothetical protein
MTDKEIRHFNYVGALYALSIGVTTDRLLVAEQDAAEINDFEAAIGIRDALKDYNNTDKQFNCSVRAEIIEEDYDDEDMH